MKKIMFRLMTISVALSLISLMSLINATTTTWPTPIQLTSDPNSDIDPSIHDSSGRLWVFFTSDRSGSPQIWYITSPDQGNTWSSAQLFPPAQYPPNPHYIGEPVLFGDSKGRLWSAWGRWVGPSTEDIYFATSDDLGATWSDTRLLISYPDVDGQPNFVEVNGEIWLVFSSWGIDYNWNIYYVKSSDRGETWSVPQGIVVSPFRHDSCSAFKDAAGKLWVFYTNLTSPYDPGTTDIWCVTTTDGGTSWSQPLQISSFGGEEGHISAVECDYKYYVFYNNRNYEDIWYVVSEDGGITWSASPERVDADPSRDQYPNAMALDGIIWVAWSSDRSGNWDVWISGTAQRELSASVKIDPNALNLCSKGKMITCYIELPEGYNVADINVSSIVLNATVPAEPTPTAIGDYDSDGVPDLMVKLDRAQLAQYILDHASLTGQFTTVALTVTGELDDGTPFQGSDTITVFVPMQKGRQGIYPK